MREGQTEADLAALVVRYFADLGYEVYQEVGSHGGRADIVAVSGPILHVIEAKMTFGFPVIEQAWRWTKMANRVSVAVPRCWTQGFGAEVARRFGVGIFIVDIGRNERYESRVTEVVRPTLRRRVSETLRKQLCDEHKTYAAAGTNSGKFWSPFKATCRALHEVVATTPGLTWREALKRVEHHYSSDSAGASTLYRLAQGGRVDDLAWLECSAERPARLYLAGNVPVVSQQALS